MAREGFVEFVLRLPVTLSRSLTTEMEIEETDDRTQFVRRILENYVIRKRAERSPESRDEK